MDEKKMCGATVEVSDLDNVECGNKWISTVQRKLYYVSVINIEFARDILNATFN